MEEITKDSQTDVILSLLNKITDDGKITKEEVNELRKHLLNEDGSYNINRKVADGLFNLLNTAKNKEVVDDSFGKLFIDAVSAYLLKDKSSTGVLDDKEVDWLVGKIESDLDIDDTVFALVQELKEKSYNKFPKKLYSAIILYRLRGIQKMLSEPNNAGEGLFYKIVEKLNECVKERDKLYIDDKCILALFSIKDQLSRKKLLQLPDDRSGRTAQKTSESLTDQFINVFCELVSANVLYDANSPYIVDKSEANKLRDIIIHKTSVDYIDKVLLDELESRSMYFPEVLAKVKFGYETASVRAKVVNALLEKLDEEKAKAAKDALVEYINTSFECTNEQKLKAELLFDLKNLTERDDHKKEEKDIENQIQNLFVEHVTKYITGEESQSPNEIDKKEEKWLEKRLAVSEYRYYQCDEDLLKRLKKSSVNFPASLEKRLSRAIMMRIFLKLKGQKEALSDTELKELEDAIFDDKGEFKIDPKEAVEFIFKIKDCICEKERVTFAHLLNRHISRIKKFFFKVWQYFFPSDKEYEKDSFEDFFVLVVSSYLLGDKDSPGKIDEAETEWLLARINQNLLTDRYDKALLKALEDKSINHPNVLHYIGPWKNSLRKFLYASRKICWIAIVFCVIASFFLFVKGAAHVIFAGSGLFAQCGNVMVVDSTQIARIQCETGLSCDTIFVKKIIFQEESRCIKNIRLVAEQNSLTNGGRAVLGVYNLKRVAKRCGAVDNILQQNSVQLEGITDVNGNVGYTTAINLEFYKINLAERTVIDLFEPIKSEDAFAEIIEAIDSFLVAMVVFILGIGIFELFIRKLEKPYKVNEKRPSWMQMNSIDDLKSSLVKVLIIAMVVGFYKKTLSTSFDEKKLLFSAIVIVLIAIAFCVTEISAHYHHRSKAGDNTNEESKAKEDKHNQDYNNKEEK